MPEKFMKLLNLWGKKPMEIPDGPRSIDEGFQSAEFVENGQSHEVVLDYMRPVRENSSFLIIRGQEDNEWILMSRDSSVFHMRAICYFESGSSFSSQFDTRFVYSNEVVGRLRIAIYLDRPDSKEPRCDPAVVIMSGEDRRDWKVLEVKCDACRYRKRRSSYTEGSESDTSSTSYPQDSANSPCSYTHRNLDQMHTDYQDIARVVPSAQELLKISHVPMIVKTGMFTQLRVDIPPVGLKWCPLSTTSNRVLQDDNLPKALHFQSRVPAWSDKFQALALEFKNRQVLPSRRNYHLLSSQTPACYFYRTAKSEYVIEILPESQLSIMQAFCIALTTSLWS
jgi:hypothetical protein